MFNPSRLKVLWLMLFGQDRFLGIDMGFWVSLAIELLVMLVLNIVFWHIKKKS